MNEIKLHDIKALVDIPDISFYIFISLAIFFLSVFLLLCFLGYRIYKNRSLNIRKKYYEILKNINLEDTKKASYEMTKYLRLIVSNEREDKLVQELIQNLEIYKYKKNVSSFDENIKSEFDRLMDAIDV